METVGTVLEEKENRKFDTRIWLVFLILLPLLINTIHTPNNDFGTVSSIVRDWGLGKISLYSPESVYFNYPPWLLLIYFPLSFIPHPFGQLIFNSLSLSLLVWSTWYLVKPKSWWVLAISLTTIYTGMLIFQGQCDAIVLASLTLGWISLQRKNPWLLGISLVGMTTKYTNVLLPMLLLLFAIRTWGIRKIIYTLAIPAATFTASLLIVGWDWPIRYYRMIRLQLAYFQSIEVITVFSRTQYPVSYRLIQPPFGSIFITIISLLSIYLIIRVSREKIRLHSLNFALALNLIISPYITFHHLVYLAPLQAKLLNQDKVWGLLLYFVALVDLLFLWLGIGFILYPIAALLILIITTFRHLNFPVVPDLVEI